jgi:hypothetical protein
VSLSVSNIWSRRGPWRGTTKKNPRQLTPQCHRMAGPERLCPWRQLRTTWANRGEAWGWMANLMAPNLRTTKNWDCLGNVDRLCLRVSQSVGVCYLSWCYASCCLVFQVPFMLVEVVNHLTFKYTPKHEPHVTPFSGSTPAVNVVWNSRKRCWCSWLLHFHASQKKGGTSFFHHWFPYQPSMTSMISPSILITPRIGDVYPKKRRHAWETNTHRGVSGINTSMAISGT